MFAQRNCEDYYFFTSVSNSQAKKADPAPLTNQNEVRWLVMSHTWRQLNEQFLHIVPRTF